MTGWNPLQRTGIVRILWLLCLVPVTGAVTAASAQTDQSCSYERAYSVDRGQVEREGDTLIVEVWGRAPTSGWTNPKLALVPDDSNPIAVAYRLIGCAPARESGGLEPLHARAFIVANPGRIQSIVVRAATNDMRFHEDATP